ncbi:DNA cytosine methyltransferase [Streptomyces sp. NPDC057245]|uniref:DNA cytosine methyltransferase n=1 Tax=Streptomyces sp. NPDC057245 TaxID=3346065 RepID=UPI003635E7EA
MNHVKTTAASPAVSRILDLFAGPGGLDVAADVLGYHVTGIEFDREACATRSAAGMDTFYGDVRRYRASFFPHAQVLTGGPPCQTFTVAGHGAGRKALDQVLEYIQRLHEVVRAKDAKWQDIFRTWRKISEDLRRKAVLAEGVKAEKRAAEKDRAATRKALKDLLTEHGSSPSETKSILKALEVPGRLVRKNAELGRLMEKFSTLSAEIDRCRAKLEELGDERTGLVLQPLWWVIEKSRRPGSTPYEAVVLEQVPAVMPVWENYALVLATLGYGTTTQLMYTEAFGVPQTRKRAVLMARLRETDIRPVVETHERYQPRSLSARASGGADGLWEVQENAHGRTPPKEAWVSMETALKKARTIQPDLPDRPAFTVVSNYGTGGDPEARGKRDHDAPSATITGKVSRNRLVHKGTDKDLPRFDRFSFAEAGVLQTFPVAYPWRGSDQPQQIGNAVPPRLALHVLRQVLEPELTGDEARARLEQAIADLEVWKPGDAVAVREHGQWEGHPLTGRCPRPTHGQSRAGRPLTGAVSKSSAR